MVKWFERSVMVQNWKVWPAGDWNSVFVNPAVNEYLSRNWECLGSIRRRKGSAFHILFPRNNGHLMSARNGPPRSEPEPRQTQINPD